MAEVPVTINGVVYPKAKRADFKPYPCTIVGSAWVTGLGIGGGPIIPEPGEPPIDIPPPEIPDPPTLVKPPPADGGWGWSPEYGWGYFPGSGQAGPK